MRAFHPVRLTRYRLSFDGATISRVQLNLTNFHGRGLIGFINYACTTRATALPKTRQPCCPARSCVDVSRGCAPRFSNPSYSSSRVFVPRDRGKRSKRPIALDRRLVRRMRCKATAMRAYIQDLLIKFCALRYLRRFVCRFPPLGRNIGQ